MNKHTPAPWVIAENSKTFIYALNEKGTNVFFANVQDPHTSKEELEANARLMAAAPDLLEALIDCEKRLTNMVGMSDLCANEIQRSINLARAAIAKARGES